MRPHKKGQKENIGYIKQKLNIEQDTTTVPVDTSTEHVKELEDEILKLRIENAYLKRTEENAFRGGSSSEKNSENRPQPPGRIQTKDILAVVGFPKATYMYWQKKDLIEKIQI